MVLGDDGTVLYPRTENQTKKKSILLNNSFKNKVKKKVKALETGLPGFKFWDPTY